MSLTEALILGLVQGLTEFFPVSSSGHLVILQDLFSIHENHLFFSILLHVATLIALLVFYAKDLVHIVRHDRDYLLKIIVGALPAVVVGFLLYDDVTSFYTWNASTVGFFLGLTGVIIFVAERFKRGHKTEVPLTYKIALLIGCIQAVAIIPGLSRSGLTIALGLCLGLNRAASFRFAFMLAIPAVGGAFVLQLLKMNDIMAHSGFNIVGGATLALISGYLSLRYLKYLVHAGSWSIFSLYCFFMGSFLMVRGLCL